MSDEVKIKDLEKEVLSWLQHRNNGWTWFFGGEKLETRPSNASKTIRISERWF